MKRTLSQAAVLAATFLVTACYSSVQSTGDASSDTRPDASDTAGEDPLPDMAPDPLPDVAPDVTPDLPPDIVPDIYPDYPSSGIDLVVRNRSDSVDGQTYYFAVWPYLDDGMEYPFEVMRFEGDMAEILYLYHPWCTVDCEDVTDPMDCCIDCAPPWVDALLALEAGDSFSQHWDGTLFRITQEICECGCSQEFLAWPATYGFTICAYEAMTCYAETCEPDEYGIIWNAYGAGSYFCSRHEIVLPRDYGSVLYFDFPVPER
jgi:hypothetical protein